MAEFLFSGFVEPKANYFRILNDWFELISEIRQQKGTRVVSIIKVLEYLIKHNWALKNNLGLTESEIRAGKRYGKKRIDLGTQLDERSILKALKSLIEFGLVEDCTIQQASKSRQYRLRIKNDDIDDHMEGVSPAGDFNGFPLPKENYFKIPNEWTDITARIDKACTILLVEYLIRHGYGYHNFNGEFLDVDEITNGRRYQNGSRYDQGIQFDVSNISRSLNEAISLKLVVWTNRTPDGTKRRLYSIRMVGMAAGNDGEYLGQLPWETPEQYEEWKHASEAGIPCADTNSDCADEKPICVDANMNCVDEEVNGANVGSICDDADSNCVDAGNLPSLKDIQSTSGKHFGNTLTTITGSTEISLAMAVVGAIPIPFLEDMGISSSSHKTIIDQHLPPEILLGWGLYITTQKGMKSSPQGTFVNRCKEKASPPRFMLRFANLSVNDWLELLSAREEWNIYQRVDVSPHLDDVLFEWMHIYAKNPWEILPPMVTELLRKYEFVELETDYGSQFSSTDDEPSNGIINLDSSSEPETADEKVLHFDLVTSPNETKDIKNSSYLTV